MRCKKTGGRRHPFTTARDYLDAYLQPRHVRLRTLRESQTQRIYLAGPKSKYSLTFSMPDASGYSAVIW